MNDLSTLPVAPLSMEERVDVSLSNVQQGLCHRFHKCENQIRQSPKTSVLGAVAVGYLLHRLPVRAILVTQVRVLAALAPPALFLFGAAKLYEYLNMIKGHEHESTRRVDLSNLHLSSEPVSDVVGQD